MSLGGEDLSGLSDAQRTRLANFTGPPAGRASLLAALRKQAAKAAASTASSAQASSSGAQKPPAHPGHWEPPKEKEKVKVTLVLVKRDVVEVRSPYNAALIDLVKRLPTRHYDSERRSWSIALRDHGALVRALKESPDLDVDLKELPDWIRTTFKEGFYRALPPLVAPVGSLEGLPAELRTKLYGYQKDGVRFGISKGGRVLIADDMGLGKTYQALGLLLHYRSLGEGPALVLCPANVRSVWEEKLRSESGGAVKEEDIYSFSSASPDLPHPGDKRGIVISSYDLSARAGGGSGKSAISYNTLILDESHGVKDETTKRYKAAKALSRRARRIVLLSGTPALSRPIELWTQIDMVLPKLFSGHEGRRKFAFRYCEAFEKRFGGHLILQEDILGELPAKTRKHVVLDKESVRTNLQSLRQAGDALASESLSKKGHHVSVSALLLVVLDKESVRTNLQSLRQAGDALASESLSKKGHHEALLQYFHETAAAKEDAVCKYVASAIREDPKRKILVFAHHANVIDTLSTRCLCRELKMSPDEYIIITGSVAAERRGPLVKAFQEDERVRVALLSIKAANAGITLTAATLVIFAELFWNPGELAQAEDRTHRLGQRKAVEVRYLVAKGTADDYLWPLVQKKLQILQSLGLTATSFKDAQTSVLQDTPEGPVRSVSKTEAAKGPIDAFLAAYRPPEEDPTEPPAKQSRL